MGHGKNGKHQLTKLKIANSRMAISITTLTKTMANGTNSNSGINNNSLNLYLSSSNPGNSNNSNNSPNGSSHPSPNTTTPTTNIPSSRKRKEMIALLPDIFTNLLFYYYQYYYHYFNLNMHLYNNNKCQKYGSHFSSATMVRISRACSTKNNKMWSVSRSLSLTSCTSMDCSPAKAMGNW